MDILVLLALICTSPELFQTKLHFPSSLSLVLQKSLTACKLDYISGHPAITTSLVLYNLVFSAAFMVPVFFCNYFFNFTEPICASK